MTRPALLLPALLLLLAAGPLRAQAPSDPFEARLRAGQTALRAGLPQTAAREYRAAVRLRPADADAHYALAGLLEDRGRMQAALAQYRQAVALLPADPRLRFNLGGALAEAGRPAAAATQYREALRLKPDFAEAAQALRALPVPLSPAGTAPTPGPSLHPAAEALRAGAASGRGESEVGLLSPSPFPKGEGPGVGASFGPEANP